MPPDILRRTMLRRSLVPLLLLVALAATFLGLVAGASARETGTSSPVTPAGISGVVDLDATDDQTCAVLTDGSVRCWGLVGYGPYDPDTGIAPQLIRTAPVTVAGITDARKVSGNCVVRADATVWCWGSTWLGTAPDPADAPAQRAGIDAVADLSVGDDATCALRTDATVWCWGFTKHAATGVYGDGSTGWHIEPTAIPGLTDATAVASGQQHVCAARTNGELWCWGNGAGGGPLPPGPLAGFANTVGVAAAENEACSVEAAGGVRCRGDNSYGEAGVPPNGYATGDLPIAGLPASVSVATGISHTCAVTAAGTAWCWGLQADGRLGNPAYGGDGTSEWPIPVLGLSGIRMLVAGNAHTCVVLADTTVRCFGSDALGQLGNGEDPLPADWPVDTPGAIQQAESTALVRLPAKPTPAPGPAPTPVRTPQAAPIPQAARSGKRVVLTAFALTVRAGRSCPARVTVTVRPSRKRSPALRKRIRTTRTATTCAITTTLTLRGKLAGQRRLAITVTGAGIRSRSRSLSGG